MSIIKKKKVSFRVYPAPIYGDQFQNVIIKSEVDIDDASRLGHDALSAFVVAEPHLPPEAISNPNDESFYIVAFENQSEVVIGASWVIPESIEYLEGTVVNITIPNAGWDSSTDIKAALASRGFKIGSYDVTSI